MNLNPKLSPTFCVLIVLILIGALGLVLVIGTEQHRNLQRADAHAAKLQPVLSEHPRIHVNLGSYTGGDGAGGMLWISGLIDSKEEFTALYRMVMDSNPPVDCRWSIQVISDGSSIEIP